MKNIFRNIKIVLNNKFNKIFILIIVIYLFYIFFLSRWLFDKIPEILNNTKSIFDSNRENASGLKSEKNLGKNNIFMNEELRKNMLLEGKKYIDKCLNEKNISKEYHSFRYLNNIQPIISAIIPLYKCEKTIKASISSIQNQNFTNFEINLK